VGVCGHEIFLWFFEVETAFGLQVFADMRNKILLFLLF